MDQRSSSEGLRLRSRIVKRQQKTVEPDMSKPYTDLPPNHPLGSSGDDENLSVVIEGYPDDNTPYSDTPSGQHADLGEPSISRHYSLGRTPLQETGIRETNIDDDLDEDSDVSDTQRLIPHDDDYDSGVEDVVIYDQVELHFD